MNNDVLFSDFKCRFFSERKKGPCVIYITGSFMDYDVGKIYERTLQASGIKDYVLCELMLHSWDDLLTPWPCDAGMKGRHFTGNGVMLLREIKEHLLPYRKEQFPESKGLYVAGYSLAGLFAIWSLYETDLFDGAVCCSGSLWYPGWKEYILQHNLNKKSNIYLSLGKKEEKTNHFLMKQVGDNTRLQYRSLQQDDNANQVTLEWNEGGHFADTEGRVSNGISWILSQGIITTDTISD